MSPCNQLNVLAEFDGHAGEIVWPNWNGHGDESFGQVSMATDVKFCSPILNSFEERDALRLYFVQRPRSLEGVGDRVFVRAAGAAEKNRNRS